MDKIFIQSYKKKHMKNLKHLKTFVTTIKEFLNEQVETLEDRLKSKLLSIGGTDVKLGLDTEEEQVRMLNDGRIYKHQILF